MALNRRNRVKSGFLDKALGRLGRFDPSGLQSVVQRLAQEREFLESLFNTIDSGIIVTDDQGRMVYFNLMATRMLGIPPETAEEEPVTRYLPDLDWAHIASLAPALCRLRIKPESERGSRIEIATGAVSTAVSDTFGISS